MPVRLASFLPPAGLAALAVAAVPLSPHTITVVQQATEDASVQPAVPAAHAREAAPATYTVRPGDTLSAIAGRACGNPGDYLALAANNNVADPDLIYDGQVFKIACQAAAQALARYAPPAGGPAHYQAAAAPPVTDAVQQPARPVVTSVSGTVGSVQACIISRESGGNPRAVNPASGAGGLYQFLPSTWQSLGFSGLPEDAPVAEQDQAFADEVAQSGYSAWAAYDGC